MAYIRTVNKSPAIARVSHHAFGAGRSWTRPAILVVTVAGVSSPSRTGAGRVGGGSRRLAGSGGTSGPPRHGRIRVADGGQVAGPRPGVQLGEQAVVVRLALPPADGGRGVVPVAEDD